jgi:signal transduction histidine kinase
LPTRRARPAGLRLRVAAALALAGLAIVGFVGLTTYFSAEHYLVRQREQSLLQQAYVDARTVRDAAQGMRRVPALETLELTPQGTVILHVDGRWYGASVSNDGPNIPAAMRREVRAGGVAHQRTKIGGSTAFVVGIPLRAVDGEYYEIFPLVELRRTLSTLRTILWAAGLAAVVLGGLLGWWMSRRVLKPVREVAAAAERVAEGALDTRIDGIADPDLRSLAASFNAMVDAVERRILRETRFVADASHELRSPLTTLATATELMAARREELPPRSREALDLLATEVDRLCRLVDDLLELGRADAGASELELDSVDVAELARQIVRRTEGPGHPVVLPEGETVAAVDKRRLERVLTNLVANAQTHGGGLCRIRVAGHEARVRIEVEDRGPGVEADDREAVFDRFYRGRAAGRRSATPGAGLGLSLVAEHVQAHGGRVWVEDADGCGARFVVDLPAVTA